MAHPREPALIVGWQGPQHLDQSPPVGPSQAGDRRGVRRIGGQQRSDHADDVAIEVGRLGVTASPRIGQVALQRQLQGVARQARRRGVCGRCF